MKKEKKDESNEDDSHPHFVDTTYPKEEPWKTNIYFGERDGTGNHGHLAISGSKLFYVRDIDGVEIIKKGRKVSNNTPK